MNDDHYLMWFLNIGGLGNKKTQALIKVFGGIKNLWSASGQDLRQIAWLPRETVSAMLSPKKNDIIEKMLRKLEINNIKFITIYGEKYPKMLKEISDAPLGLYIKGELPGDNSINISVIGSRRCSEYGLTAAFKISKELAQKGVTIVSGMAKGIDSMAHRGALEGKGKTIAVLGNGLDICYPIENYELMREIIDNGCVISEYLPGVKPLRSHFPARNRIISGLSRGLLVVEAADRSGTNITVEQALDQGREIFAVPGSIFSKTSFGANRLIKDGAYLVQSYEDVLEGLGIDTANIIEGEKKNYEYEQKATTVLTEGEQKIFDCISIEPVTVDEIIQITGMNIQDTQFCLTTLELNECIRRLPGQRYIRKF